MDLNEFAVEPKLWEDGKTIPLGEGASITVRSASSEKAQKARERLWKPYAGWRTVPDDITARLNAQWLAEGIIVGWDGITLDGKPLAFDAKKAADLMQMPKFKAFRTRILGIALDEANFQNQAEAAAEGN